MPQNTYSTHSLDNLHCMLLGIPAKNCIRNPIKSLLKSSIISWSANLPGCRGACLEDPFVHLTSNHLFNVSTLNLAIGKVLKEQRYCPCISVTLQFNRENIGELTITVHCRECYRTDESGAMVVKRSTHDSQGGKGPGKASKRKWLSCHLKNSELWAKSSGKGHSGQHEQK